MRNYGHRSCPSCPSSDAYFVYRDGHGHCFSCGYHDHGTKSIASMKKKISMEIEAVSSINTSVYTPDLPKIAVLWLKKYGISNKEISDHKLMWNLKTTSLCFPIYSGNKLVITNERYFGVEMNHPKYLTKGNKTGIMHAIAQPSA